MEKKLHKHFLILENGVSYQVFLNDGLMTGIFLDQRWKSVRKFSWGSLLVSLLNMFSFIQLLFLLQPPWAESNRDDFGRSGPRELEGELSESAFCGKWLALMSSFVDGCLDYYAKRREQMWSPIQGLVRIKRHFQSLKITTIGQRVLEILHPGGTLILSTNAATTKQ